MNMQLTMLRELIGNRAEMYRIGPKVITNLLKGILVLEKRRMVLQNIQPSTIMISKDGEELHFGDLSHVTKEGHPKDNVEMLHPPYVYDLVERLSFKDYAHSVKDRYSIGIVILEILAGSDLVIMANGEELVAQLLRDLFDYLSPATLGLLQYLIFNEHAVNVQAFIDQWATGHYEVLTADILRVEAAFQEDARLQVWHGRTMNYIEKETFPAYIRHRLMPGDIQRNIDWEVVKTLRENEANGI